jgi:hypothetical protein
MFLWQCSFGLRCCVDCLVEANISEKHAVSIFGAEVLMMEIACFSKMVFHQQVHIVT